MSERRLRETTAALPQRFNFSETRLRAIQLRAWPGAMRTGATDAYTPVAPAEWSAAVSVTIPSGRWLILGEGTMAFTVVDGAEHPMMQFGATDADSGEPIGPDYFDTPTRAWYSSTVTGYVEVPMSLSGDISMAGDIETDPRRVIVSLLVKTDNNVPPGSATAFTVYHARLRLIPI